MEYTFDFAVRVLEASLSGKLIKFEPGDPFMGNPTSADAFNALDVVRARRPITQDWVARLGLRHQGTLMAAVRGCDVARKDDGTKALTRYLRAAILNAHCGDPRKARSFIEVPESNKAFAEAVRSFFAEMDALPNHFVLHFIQGAEIVGYYHPETEPVVTGFPSTLQHRRRLPEEAVAQWRAWGEGNAPLYPAGWGDVQEETATRVRWHRFYLKACDKLHLNPETREQLDARLGADEDTFGKAQS